MKNLTTLFTFLIFTSVSFGQSIIDKYYSDLEDREDATTVYVSQAMFELTAKFDIDSDNEDFNEIQDFIKSVKSFNLVKVPNLDAPKQMYISGTGKMNKTHTELVRVKDEGNLISVYIDEENEVIYELAVIGVVEGDFLAASLIGEMDLDLITKFINKAQSESFEGLTALRNVGISNMKVYPNPSNSGSGFTIEVPENMIGGTANIYDLNGSLLRSMNADAEKLSVPTDGFIGGSYLVELVNEGTSLKKKMIVLE